MNLIDRYLEKKDFTSYEDYYQNLRYKDVTEFNFGYDVVDEYARLAPEKRAVVWCNNRGEERTLTFGELSELSDRAANMLRSLGLKKGDFVMTMLNRRYEYYIINVARLPRQFGVRQSHLLYQRGRSRRIRRGSLHKMPRS